VKGGKISMKKKRIFNFQVGECWEFQLTGEPDCYYYVFLIVSEIKRNNQTYWVAIKNGGKKPRDLCPVVIDKYGTDRSVIGEHFYCVDKSRVKPKWET
jgi:hypothetical protein